MTAPPSQLLRQTHSELLPCIEVLCTVADSVGQTSIDTLRRDIDDAHDFLVHTLIPHAQAEDHVLYPVIEKVLGSPEAAAPMRRDHIEIVRMARELASIRQQITGVALGDAQVKALRRVLYGLYAVIRSHIAKENEIFFPLLDAHLTPTEFQSIIVMMAEAEREARIT